MSSACISIPISTSVSSKSLSASAVGKSVWLEMKKMPIGPHAEIIVYSNNYRDTSTIVRLAEDVYRATSGSIESYGEYKDFEDFCQTDVCCFKVVVTHFGN